MSTILSKSPYHINVSDTDLIYAEVDVYVYTGEQTVDRFGTPNYTLKSTAINESLSFDIGSLVNDAIQYPSDSSYRTDGAWLDYEIRRYTDDGTGPVLVTDAIVSYSELVFNLYTSSSNPSDVAIVEELLTLSTNMLSIEEFPPVVFPCTVRFTLVSRLIRSLIILIPEEVIVANLPDIFTCNNSSPFELASAC